MSDKNKSVLNADKREIRITGVPAKLANQINNIVSHQGSTAANFLKDKLMNIVYSYPEHVREHPLPKD